MLLHGSCAEETIHAAFEQRYHSIVGGQLSLVLDGVCPNNRRINRVSADSRFSYGQSGRFE
jgi:hypothetical protein